MWNFEMPLFGTVVKSVAGRDRKRVFIVMGKTEKELLVTDGKLRPVSSPKAKNPRHVRPIGHLTEAQAARLQSSMTDGTVRDILKGYDSAICQAEQH